MPKELLLRIMAMRWQLSDNLAHEIKSLGTVEQALLVWQPKLPSQGQSCPKAAQV